MTLGQKIRRTRQEKGLTQREVVGDRITRNMLSQIENDLATPSVGTLEYLASVLGVKVSWLMEESGESGDSDILSQARTLLRRGQWTACRELLEQAGETENDEALLMAATAAWHEAEYFLQMEQLEQAQAMAQAALARNRAGLYSSPEIEISAAAILARSRTALRQNAEEAVEQYRTLYLEKQLTVGYHLLMARYNLEQEHIQAAEREIWSIADLPEKDRGEYLILRGRIAIKKEQYENAALYLKQAEALPELPRILRRELMQSLEICCRERGEYKLAYEYATMQLALNQE